MVCIDEKHPSFHTLGERFAAFGGLLKRDGYRVTASTAAEIAAVRAWVDGGGALLLIADHQPLAGAAAKLAAAFDVDFTDGFARREPNYKDPDIFRIADRTLREHAITAGRDARESVAGVRTIRGQAFRAPQAAALIVLHSPTRRRACPSKGGCRARRNPWERAVRHSSARPPCSAPSASGLTGSPSA